MPIVTAKPAFRALSSALAVVAGIICSGVAHAQGQEESSWWNSAKNTVAEVAEQGQWDLYVSGYSHHSRSTYDERRVRRLNEKAWGLGFGKTLRNEAGNEESLFGLVVRDSRRNWQWSVGYAYQWITPVFASEFEVGAGLGAMLIRREDWFDGVPFPAILPVASAGVRQAKLMATYVPRMSTKKGKGNVLLLFARFEF